MTPAAPPTKLPPAPRLAFSERGPAGIRFTERMSGWWSLPRERERDRREIRRREYEEAASRGRRAGRRIDLILTVVGDNLTTMLADPQHRAGFIGTATLEGLAGGPVTAVARRGRFRLFPVEGPDDWARRMDYRARLTAPDGTAWLIDGFKAIRPVDRDDGGDDPKRAGLWRMQQRFWREQTRLYFTLWRGGFGAPRGIGVLSLTFTDFLRQLATMDAPGATTPIERLDTVGRFAVFFAGALRDTYGGPLARSRYAPPNWHMRRRRPLAVPDRLDVPWRAGARVPVEVAPPVTFTANDGAHLQLRRYRRGGTRGPIVLAPGFGVRADSFAIDTVPFNLVEYLAWQGWDVWLFDYRASPELAASETQFSIDDIAARDWPAALAEVARRTGRRQVDVVAHCVGGMTFMMAALGGHLLPLARDPANPVTIRSAVCSAVAAHPVGPRLNELKAMAQLGVVLQLFGKQALRVTVHAADTFRRPFADRLLKYYPTDDPCDNPVCRRIRFVFGESYLHARLNRPTHDAVIEMFGDPRERRPASASLRALRQLARIVSAGELRDEDGGRVYTTRRAAGLIDFRLALLSGRRNHIFLPDGLDRTHRWLAAARDGGHSTVRDLEIVPLETYAHMDAFIGARAADDVFPQLTAWLARGAPL